MPGDCCSLDELCSLHLHDAFERGAPVDPLLAGLCSITKLPRAVAELRDDGKLAALWQRVMR